MLSPSRAHMRDLVDYGKLLTDTDQVDQAKYPRRAPGYPEVDGPQQTMLGDLRVVIAKSAGPEGPDQRP